MRSAEAKKNWQDFYSSSKYSTYLDSISLDNCLGYTGTFPFSKGITAFCGLNGVGKSTLISCIKQSLGILDDSIVTNDKGHGVKSAIMHHNGNVIPISPDNSAINQGVDIHKLVYIDSDQSLELLKLWAEQSNLDEYLEQFESNTYSTEQIRDISWLIGKNYDECKTIEVDEESSYIPVFFEVKQKDQNYTSVSMGLGEHFLMYIYYVLSNMESNSILIIEEPESFISVLSQQRLLDYFAKIGVKKRISIIISTHSPHILSTLRNESIRIVGNAFGKMIIRIPDVAEDAKEHLGIAYQYINYKKATVFVEDYIARLFLDVLLNEAVPYLRNTIDIVSVEGCEGITNRLSFNDKEYMTHRFIGIYDGDMKDKLDSSKLKWPWLFLPVDECVEIEIYKYLETEDNIISLCNIIQTDSEKFCLAISKRVGEDHHDWLLDLCKDIKIKPIEFIEAFYSLWKNDNYDKISAFINDIEKLVYGEALEAKDDKVFATV